MGSLVCRVELHKKNGVIITVENDDEGITQTMVMDGQTITTTCEGMDDTSEIIQAPDGITIKCREFVLEADTITCQSSGMTTHKSGSNMMVRSTAAMELGAGAGLKAAAGAAMKLTSSEKMDMEASGGDVTISGVNVDASSDMKTSLNGQNVEMKGTMGAKLEGGMVDVKGTKATLEGSAMTTIGGGIIKVG